MSLKALQDYIYYSKYARYNKEKKRRETWDEAIDRVKNMHLEKYAGLDVEQEIEWAFEISKQKRVLGSQRALQFGGNPILKNHARIYNCCSSYCDRIRFFQESMYLLLCGCGVGFSVQKHHIAKLPKFSSILKSKGKRNYTVEDSIEGWANALGILLATYFRHDDFPDWEGFEVTFDYSLIRKKGETISSGGKAPGPEPLRTSLEIIRGLLEDRILEGYTKIRPIDAYDIVMHASDCVLSGGVRRSASICLFSLDDEEMLKAKTGDWLDKNPQRGRSNNSVMLVRDEIKKEDFIRVAESIREFGEPGFFFAENKDVTTNPCFHRDTRILTDHGYRRIYDLYKEGNPVKVCVDNRVVKDEYFEDNYGISVKQASEVKLTQKDADIYCVTTEHGNTLYVTNTHEFPTLRGKLKLKEITTGDSIFLESNEGLFGNFGTYEQGLILGILSGDGTISKEYSYIDIWEEDFQSKEIIVDILNKELTKNNLPANKWISQQVHENGHQKLRIGGKNLTRYLNQVLLIDDIYSLKYKIPECLWQGSKEFVVGYLQGFHFADGSVQKAHRNVKKASISCRFHQSNLHLLQEIQILLNSFGIISRISLRRRPQYRPLPDGKGNNKNYFCRNSYDLIINRPNLLIYQDKIGFFGKKKLICEKYLDWRGANCRKKEKFLSKIVSIEYFGKDDVFCLNEPETNSVIANGIVTGQCVEIGMFPSYENQSGFQFCVKGDTKLITRNGVENIEDAVGKEIEIWNGESWKKVTPFQTGKNRKLYRVKLGDGSYLDCTENHKWLVKDRFMRKYVQVETKDLMNVSKYKIHAKAPNVVFEKHEGIHETFAYEYGFILGDGCSKRENKPMLPVANLFGSKNNLALKGRVTTKTKKYNRMVFEDVDRDFCYKLKYEQGLPKEIFTWDRESLYEFISGWIDSDGSKTSCGFRIYGKKDKLQDLQLIFTKLGFYSSLNLMQETGVETNLGTRKNAIWYIQVSNVKDLKSRRLKLVPKKTKGKGIHQIIKGVEELDGLHDTYCVHEKEKNMCLFNNVLTFQCNLSEINGSKIKTKEDFAIACKAAAIIGTLQAGYTDFPYLGEITEKISRKEALLGVSITGTMDSPEIIFNPDIQKEMAQLVVKTNEEFAAKLKINPSARATCIKPAGTTSLVLGTASGIHPHHAKRYFRAVQANQLETVFQHFKEINSFATEKSVWSAPGSNDEVITFCVEVPAGAKVKNDLSAVELLKYVKLTQNNWVNYGKSDTRCTIPGLSHNVSNTINVKQEEWNDVIDFIYENKESFAGVSLLPSSGDLDYPQAPMVNVLNPKEILKEYGDCALLASGLIVDGLHVFDNNLWQACEEAISGRPYGIPEGEEYDGLPPFQMNYGHRLDWIRRVRQFADRYLEGNVKKCCYLMKHVNNWKKWLDLNREFKDVDYTALVELVDETKPMETIACSGGKCDLF